MSHSIIIPTIVALSLVPCNASLPETDVSSDSTQTAAVYSTGLISGYGISISADGTSILLTGKTNCTDTMKTVGLKSIKIQQSSDGTHWSNYSTYGSLTNSNSMRYFTSGKNIGSVAKGYHYRVVCNHYAKEDGLFGSSESISNVSNSVFIPNNYSNRH